MGQEQRNESKLKSACLPLSPLFHSSSNLKSFHHHLLLERQRLQAPSFFCVSIVVITWATPSTVKESCIFFSACAWPAWKVGTFDVTPCASACIARCDLAVICFSCLTGVDSKESKWESAQGVSRHDLVCLLNYCCQKLMSISPQTFSYTNRKLTRCNEIFHMPVIVGTGYASQEWEISSRLEAAAQKQVKLLQESCSEWNEQTQICIKIQPQILKGREIWGDLFCTFPWHLLEVRCTNMVWWCIDGCAEPAAYLCAYLYIQGLAPVHLAMPASLFSGVYLSKVVTQLWLQHFAARTLGAL